MKDIENMQPFTKQSVYWDNKHTMIASNYCLKKETECEIQCGYNIDLMLCWNQEAFQCIINIQFNDGYDKYKYIETIILNH